MHYLSFSLLLLSCLLSACNKTDLQNNPQEDSPMLTFKIKLDPTQPRLNALAQPASMPSGHAGQDPEFNGLSAHKIELVPSIHTPIYGGPIAYQGEETFKGGDRAIDFEEAVIVNHDEIFISTPLKNIKAGTYPYIRVSVSYQNYEVYFNINNIPNGLGGTIDLQQQKGTVASFLGFNTYIKALQPKRRTQTINANKRQGYWGFETDLSQPYQAANNLYTGDATSTTVVNPLHSTIRIPNGSCLVTGSFAPSAPLVITGNETEDIVVNLSFSTNKSFEWKDDNNNGELDIDASTGTMETVMDMGLRGLFPSVE